MKTIGKALDVVVETDVFAPTVKGESELRGAGTSLAPSELEILVCVDGESTVAQIGAVLRSRPAGVVKETLRKFIQNGLIGRQTMPEIDFHDFAEFFVATEAAHPTRAEMNAARKEASAGTSKLKAQGYYVRIARRAATARKLQEGQTLSAVVIEDEPSLAKFLKQYLALEQFDVRIAGNREEIVKELSRAPPPDLVLLDVMLPDADGFDVLVKMRQHPVLKSVPIVMLTAKATREAVLKGLAGGADGYITKPFEAEALVKAVNAVLGLSKESEDIGAAPDLWKQNLDK